MQLPWLGQLMLSWAHHVSSSSAAEKSKLQMIWPLKMQRKEMFYPVKIFWGLQEKSLPHLNLEMVHCESFTK